MSDQWHPWRTASHVAASLLILRFLVGCAGSLDPAEFEEGGSTTGASSGSGNQGPGTSTSSGAASSAGCAASVPATIFAPTCGASGCHNATSKAQALDLASPGVAARLVGVRESERPDLALLLVNAAQPDQSVILTKLQSATVPYGAQMPLSGTLSAEQIACVRSWVISQTGAGDGGTEQ